METTTIKRFLLIGLALTFLSFELPSGWFKSGSDPNSYDMRVEKGAGYDGKNAATIQSIMPNISGFGTLMQSFAAEKYLGKRIRLSGYVKTKDVAGKACFWLRVEKANSQQILSFDNMNNRPIIGTNDWKKYEIVVDVPATASKISYGALVRGTGKIWFDNLSFEIVDSSVETTGKKIEKSEKIIEPTNLNFDE
ncbi:hypothetical protein SAMN04488062_10820 [Flavobacterium omnivorum]|jgi:hypothetical protein|uniref:Uncharacterized protein n=1 Tax=Flavobacterium omnivorum TaxID=178355 RepID=A0A1G8CLR4_9FLAO|nr:hypothetical protein [Flavobacterium omnivorum]SDH46497.1 hypothetical protein SAMN04488062_10820 [Flavobacterium omnivorum]